MRRIKSVTIKLETDGYWPNLTQPQAHDEIAKALVRLAVRFNSGEVVDMDRLIVTDGNGNGNGTVAIEYA